MNCEAYIIFYRAGNVELYPNNIDTAFLSDIFAARPQGDLEDENPDFLAIKRKGDMVYYVYFAPLDGKSGDMVGIMVGLNNVLIDDIFVLSAFMACKLLDALHSNQIARYDSYGQCYHTLDSSKYPVEFLSLEACKLLRIEFNLRFHDCHATLGPMDYTRQPYTDLMHLDCTGLISHRQCASHEALPISRSIEAGNTVIVVPLGRSSFILAHENAVLLDTVKQYEDIIETLKQRQSAAGIDTEDTTATGTYTEPSNDYPHVPPEPTTRKNPLRTLGETVIGILTMLTILIVVRDSTEGISPEIMDKYVSGLGWDPFIDAFRSVSIKIGLPAGALVWFVGTFFKTFLKAALITFSLAITLFIAVGFYPVHEMIFDDTPLSFLVETSVLYGLFSVCCGMACCRLLTRKRSCEEREDTQALRNKGYMSGLGIAVIWSGIYFVTTHTMPFSDFHAFVIVWLLPGVCGAAAGWLRHRNVWIYRSALICSAGAAAVLFPIYPHDVLVPAVLFGTFAITVALLRDLFTETTGTNPAQQPIAYNPE